RELAAELDLCVLVPSATGLLDGGLDRQFGLAGDVGGVLAGSPLLLQQPLEAPEVGLDGGVLATPLPPQPADEEEEADQQHEAEEEHVGNDERRCPLLADRS